MKPKGISGLGGERLEAFARLDLAPTADARAIKQAYRRATMAHPPDTDPEAFRSIREAYERLSDPWAEASDRLRSMSCFIDAPQIALRKPAPRHALAFDLLRATLGRLDGALLRASDAEDAP